MTLRPSYRPSYLQEVCKSTLYKCYRCTVVHKCSLPQPSWLNHSCFERRFYPLFHCHSNHSWFSHFEPGWGIKQKKIVWSDENFQRKTDETSWSIVLETLLKIHVLKHFNFLATLCTIGVVMSPLTVNISQLRTCFIKTLFPSPILDCKTSLPKHLLPAALYILIKLSTTFSFL